MNQNFHGNRTEGLGATYAVHLRLTGNSGGLRHGRAGPLPRAPRFEGAPRDPPGAPRAEPALRIWASGATVSVLKRFCTNNLSRNIREIWPFSKKWPRNFTFFP